MNTEDYLGLMRPWYGLENDGKPKPYSEAPLEAELESVDAFDFTPLPFSAELHGRAQTRSLVSFELLQKAHERELSAALLAHIHCLTHGSFEHLILEVVRAAGFAKDRPDFAQRVGRSGDGGIDGIIKEDRLGLDVIYTQAKRWTDKPVGRPEVQQFQGALSGNGAIKGIFITTSTFTKEARDYAAGLRNSKIVLIDGDELAELMIDQSIGVATAATYEVKRVDSDYFAEGEE